VTKRRRPQRGRAVPPPHAGEPPVTNPALRAAVLEAVDTQLELDDPPETRQTLERLVAQGYTREGARELLAAAVLSEIFDVMSSGQPYDAARYKAALARLPRLPCDEE
jgi:hypothetical protein